MNKVFNHVFILVIIFLLIGCAPTGKRILTVDKKGAKVTFNPDSVKHIIDRIISHKPDSACAMELERIEKISSPINWLSFSVQNRDSIELLIQPLVTNEAFIHHEWFSPGEYYIDFK